MEKDSSVKNGVAAAALLAAGFGCVTLGLLTVASEFSSKLVDWLSWYPPSGILTGQAGMAVLLWLSAWALLHLRWGHREVKNFSSISVCAWVLILFGYLGTFPPFYKLLSGR